MAFDIAETVGKAVATAKTKLIKKMIITLKSGVVMEGVFTAPKEGYIKKINDDGFTLLEISSISAIQVVWE